MYRKRSNSDKILIFRGDSCAPRLCTEEAKNHEPSKWGVEYNKRAIEKFGRLFNLGFWWDLLQIWKKREAFTWRIKSFLAIWSDNPSLSLQKSFTFSRYCFFWKLLFKSKVYHLKNSIQDDIRSFIKPETMFLPMTFWKFWVQRNAASLSLQQREIVKSKSEVNNLNLTDHKNQAPLKKCCEMLQNF